ncbi:hypothetical protein [Capillimicrobium parvum]|uniref:Uncharacterized protein n=1 Tax=Capillimicrobium parvum TaxID=2884022 RepID=A0A9E6Y177_9ACTN|nr:hypothetical protein [Capillimicrobium parvum]UGS37893.1 hypothetical protein DSM104329_04314 [Capillimicrobium parvum]
MSEAAATDFEALLRRALAPVDPPDELAGRVEETLTSITEMAADELEAWEIGAMRDPRNWVRPAAAVLAGTTAGVALVALRTKQRSKQRRRASNNVLELAERTVHDAMHEARRLWR